MSINPFITHQSQTQALYAPYGVVTGNIPLSNVTIQNEMTVNIKDNTGISKGNFNVSEPNGQPTVTLSGVDGTNPQLSIISLTPGNTLDHAMNLASYTNGGDDRIGMFAINDTPSIVGDVRINGINTALTSITLETLNGNTATDTSVQIGNGGMTISNGTVPNSANLSVPTVNGRVLGAVAEWLDRDASPIVFNNVTNTASVLIESFTTLKLNNYYRVTCFVAVQAGAGITTSSDIRFSLALGGEGLVDLMTVTGGMTPTGETWTGTISAICQETSGGDALNLVATASDANPWDITIYSGHIENLGTVVSGVPDPF